MEIRKTVKKTVMVEIGELDCHKEFPMKGRIKHNMKTVCNVCGKDIRGETFIGGFKKGHANMMFHPSCFIKGDPR